MSYKESKAFLVLKDGKMVIEHYFDTFTQDSLWYWASAGKSLSAFLVGRAQENGLLDIDDKTSDYLGTGWTSAPANKEDLVTIRHQLTMTTGLDDGTGNADCTTPACLQYLADAGTRWAYHNGPYTLTHDVVEAASGQTFNQFTNTNVKQQTGMDGIWWLSGFNDVYLSTARSMARFGLLMQNNGVWNGDSVMHDQQYFYDMTHSSQSLNESYGYLWWLNGQSTFMVPTVQTVIPGPAIPSAPNDMYAALGKNGQTLCIAPNDGLVVVRMGNSISGGLVSLTLAEGIWARLSNMACGVDIANSNTENAIGIYPNPATESITIKGTSVSGYLTVEVYNSLGQMELRTTLPSLGTLNIESLAAGIYTLNVWNGASVSSSRFVKE
jgi:CubicO group peptidase (beta-lactamase class C family)